MWKKLIVAILPILALGHAFIVVPEDEIIKSYKSARTALTPEQQEFLMELLAADDAIIETTRSGIVDDILQAISGAGSNVRVNIVGGSNQQQQTGQNQQPALNILNPTFTIGGTGNGNNLQKALVNSTDSNATAPAAGISSASGIPSSSSQMQSNVTTIGGNNNHLFSTISQVIRNSNSRNVTGIVDESLRIATPAPIREFVTGILNVVYCNGIRRLLGRC